ncbi:hypothetical protein BDEG_28464 [Batrachochytrium dendrobatidis JEL423]|uniref:Glutathione S-transferase n=1 Tax=Batrachochytrium dendrobatidis (strain JEL423) TaxID=403673 RepID=A0A177X043_BATDL|nr:hypothetical protein BDEG_28464 [Batrachochytrium dendrobatidis JEL423]
MSGEITLYTVGTPNGWKASIALEELALPYKVHAISFKSSEQKEDWFLKLNPNGRIPTIVDGKRDNFAVFESGAILLYLAEHYDPEHKLLSADANLRSQTIQWVMWQMGGLGPMMGQANHFVIYAPEKIPYVLETQLSDGREYIVGNYSIADIACFGWVAAYDRLGLPLDSLPHLKKWLFRVGARDAVKRGTNVPTKSTLIEDGFKINPVKPVEVEIKK